MRLGGRLAAAGEVLADAIGRRRPVADALKDWGLAHRFAGSGDRAAIGNIAYDALRRRRSIAARIGSDETAALAEGALYAGWGETPETLAARLEGDRFAPALVGAWDADAAMDDAARADVPDWAAPHLAATWGDDWVAEAAALAARPPLDLRANALKATRDDVLGELRGAEAGPAPDAIRYPAGEGASRQPNVTSEAGYRLGRFEVQDAGSQLVARLAAVQGGQVLDYCAGGGGKTLALAALMGNRGQIHAHDADRHRLAPIHERLARAGARNVHVHPPGGDLASLAGAMDAVLVDAPCTGSGTWRRRPDAKWRLRESALEVRGREQDAVLDGAAAHARPGGRLVYVTCSVFGAENGERVAAFLARRPEFEAVGTAGIDDAFDAAPKRADAHGGAILSPLTTGTDGFYVAVLKRR